MSILQIAWFDASPTPPPAISHQVLLRIAICQATLTTSIYQLLIVQVVLTSSLLGYALHCKTEAILKMLQVRI